MSPDQNNLTFKCLLAFFSVEAGDLLDQPKKCKHTLKRLWDGLLRDGRRDRT